jgi:sulfatase modifying factor 1
LPHLSFPVRDLVYDGVVRLTLGLCLALTVVGCKSTPLMSNEPSGRANATPDAAAHPDVVSATQVTANQGSDASDDLPSPSMDAALMPDAPVPEAGDVAPSIAPSIDGRGDTTVFGDADRTPPPCPSCDVPPSCAGEGGIGLSRCGPDHDSCCTSLVVPGGSFFRSYDGVSCPGAEFPQPIPFLGCYTQKIAPATVSTFRLDKYLVTLARFRRFIDAVVAGWVPPAGAGRHEHVNGGRGLADLGAPGAFETGWDPAWTAKLPRTRDEWDGQPGGSAWSGAPGADEDLPMGDLLWAEAYAFCIWDGGFLPTEAEWNYAAAGGPEQRVYPWSTPPTSTTLDCQHAAFTGSLGCETPNGPLPVGSRSPAGDGRWGHTDLVGEMDQWGLDWLGEYVTPSVDGAQLQLSVALQISGGEPMRVLRGLTSHGLADAPPFLVAGRDGDFPWDTYTSISSVRCARAPLPAPP